jgi:hypothetical protein
MLMETKITLGQTPTHLSPTHSTPSPGWQEQVIFHVSPRVSLRMELLTVQSKRLPPRSHLKPLQGWLVQKYLSDYLAVEF